MGTRNLVVALLDGKYKIAQYGQWDGYLNGQGKTVIDFIKSMKFSKFKKALSECSFLSDDEIKSRWEECGATGQFVSLDVSQKFATKYPELSRDTGAEVLTLVQDRGVRKLANSIDFANDAMFCEYAYVIDMDAKKLEIYAGRYEQNDKVKGRFKSLPLFKTLSFVNCKKKDCLEKLLADKWEN